MGQEIKIVCTEGGVSSKQKEKVKKKHSRF